MKIDIEITEGLPYSVPVTVTIDTMDMGWGDAIWMSFSDEVKSDEVYTYLINNLSFEFKERKE